MSSPTVSIIMTAAHANATIASALDAIQAQDYSHIVDVVIAAADEKTAAAAARPGVTVVKNPSRSTPSGLNRALSAGNGEVVVRVDAHSVIPPGYVTLAVRTLIETSAENVGGMQVPIGDTFWSRAIAAAMASPAGSGDARYRIGGKPGPVETVYLGTFRRSTLDGLGGYDESFERHQDYELNERIRRSGGTVWFEPRLKVEYRPRSSLGELARQYFEYGTWKRSFARSHHGSLLPRQMLPPILTVTLIVTFLLSVLSPWFLVVPASYFVGLVIAGLFSFPRARSASVGTPLALATMHLSWGLGFLMGQRRDR
jgi:glycosyltransferase involved in cell wall biosynthesis